MFLVCSVYVLTYPRRGFAYGLLDTMNAKVRSEMNLQGAKASLMAVAYYVAYIPSTFWMAGPLIRFGGYRITFLVGLFLFGTGNFIVSSGAQLVVSGQVDKGYSLMVQGMYSVGSGIATLERSANTYVQHCGHKRYAATRLNLAQSMAAIGTVIAPLIAAKFIFQDGVTDGVVTDIARRAIGAGGDTEHAMASVVRLYRICGGAVLGFTAFCAVLFFRTNLVPEIDAAVHAHPSEDAADRPAREKKSWGNLYKRTVHHPVWKEDRLWYASLANFFNLSCQVAVAQFLISYCEQQAGMSHRKGAHMLSIAQALFVVGRFVMSALARFFKARMMLLIFIIGAFLTTTATAFAPGLAGVGLCLTIMFFEGPLFPTIFATLDVVEDEHVSLREDILISSISGGALLSPLVGALSDFVGSKRKDGHGDATAFVLIAAGFAITGSYVVAINTKKSYKQVIDAAAVQEEQKVADVEMANVSDAAAEEEGKVANVSMTEVRAESPERRVESS